MTSGRTAPAAWGASEDLERGAVDLVSGLRGQIGVGLEGLSQLAEDRPLALREPGKTEQPLGQRIPRVPGLDEPKRSS